MGKILIPATAGEDWKAFLAEPDKQWKRGYSARTLAYSWQQADGFPPEVRAAFDRQPELAGLELLLAIPEHQVPLPGGSRPSQNDLWVLARNDAGLVSITVEGKVEEPFGPTVEEWLRDASPGKRARLEFLCELLGLDRPLPRGIRYQLLHRTASAFIEARRFHAGAAVTLVHSFSPARQWFEDYRRFVSLFGVATRPDALTAIGEPSGVAGYLGWVCGDERFRSI